MLNRELQEALLAAQNAALFVMREYAEFVPIPNAPATISTHVDRGSQEIILQHLHAAFPQDGLIAEEITPTVELAPKNPSRIWIVDPIDGTRGFAMKNGEFCVMLGLCINGESVLGVVLEPITNRVTYATRGGGCWTIVNGGEPVRCEVNAQSNLDNLTLVISRPSGGKVSRAVRTLEPKQTIETYSAGIKLAMVARGIGDAYLNSYSGFHDWDLCPGHILVEEAGGRVSLYDGRPILYACQQPNRTGMIASNGRIHDAALAKLTS